MSSQTFHFAAYRLVSGLCLIVILSSRRQLSTEAFTSSQRRDLAFCLQRRSQSQSDRTTRSRLFGTHQRRRKRDVVRETIRRVIPGLKQRTPKRSYPSTGSSTVFQTSSTPKLPVALINSSGATEARTARSGLIELTDRDKDFLIMANQTTTMPSTATATTKGGPAVAVLTTHDETIPASVTDTLKRRKNSLYKPPETAKSRRLNELELEFRNMLLHFANYTEADVLSIVDPKMRLLFEGIAASAHSEPVYRAFEILFEDLLPLRIAGRVLFGKLRQFMDRSVAEQAEDIAIISECTGLASKYEREKLEELRLLFLTTASKLNKSNRLSSEQLMKTGILTDVATRVLSFESTESLIKHLDKDGAGKLGFVDLVTGLWNCAIEICGIEECNPQKVLFQVLLDLNRSMPTTDLDLDESRKDQQNRRRYDDMVAAFIEWKDFLPEKKIGATESRRMEIIRGCFVGAEIPGVVAALRVVYMDYKALRIAGDFIFSLVSNRIKAKT